MDYKIPEEAFPSEVKISKELLIEEMPDDGMNKNENRNEKKRKDSELAPGFHEKKEKNKKVNLGNTRKNKKKKEVQKASNQR